MNMPLYKRCRKWTTPVFVLLFSFAPFANGEDLKVKPITAEDRAHWAFVPPRRPEVPKVKETTWPTNPIDAFVLEKLEETKLAHAVEADRATLLRRLSFDLIGLPPTPEEIDAFLADRSPNAYEKQVDRLLDSPQHGEPGRSIGSTWRVTPTPTASNSIRRGPTPGAIAIGSSTRSIKICLMTDSSVFKSPATRSSRTIPPRSSRPVSTAVSPTWSISTTRDCAGKTRSTTSPRRPAWSISA